MATKTPPPGMGLSSFTNWWQGAYPEVQNEWNTSAQNIGGKRASLTEFQNSWKPMSWEGSGWQTRYQNQQAGMDSLASQINAYQWDSTNPEVGKYVAGLYGMTPEQWASIQGQNAQRMADPNFAAETDASAANAYLSNLSNSSFMQEQDKSNRVAMRQAEEAIGKQLESVFGERGGMGGFQAAYELTSQLQSSYLQQKTQQNLGIFNQAVAAVNANNQYFQNLIQQGAISGKEYLQFRFDQLQTGYQNYMNSMAQTMNDWQALEQVDRAQFNQISANLQSQVDNMTDQMTLEMGGETNLSDYIQSLYETYTQPILDMQAQIDEQNEAERSTGGALLTTGATVAGAGVAYAASTAGAAAIAAGGAAAAIPVIGWVVGGLLLVVGLGFLIAGNTGPDTRSPEQKAADRAAQQAAQGRAGADRR